MINIILSHTLLIFQTIAIWTLLDGMMRIIFRHKYKNSIKYSIIEILIGQALFFGLVIGIVVVTNSAQYATQLGNSINSISRLGLSIDAATGGTLSIFTSNQIDNYLTNHAEPKSR